MSKEPHYTTDRIPVSTLGSGHELALVVHRLEGTSPGPTLGICGGLHGDEPDTVEYVRRFVEVMKVTPFNGTILAVSCGNPLAYESRSRNTPNDMTDLNRVFPGDPDGLLTQQLAHKLFAVFAERCNYFVDFHCGQAYPTVDYVYVHGDEQLARSVGSRLLYTGASYDGSLAFCLEQTGVHTTVVELGGGRVNATVAADQAVTAMSRIMMHARMIPGQVTLRGDQILLDKMVILRPHHGGMLLSNLSLHQLGTLLPKGTPVGKVVHAQTFETLEELTAPFSESAVVLAREGFSPVSVGDFAFMFGRPVHRR